MKLPRVDDCIVLRAWTLWLANLSAFVVELKERGFTEEAEGLEKAGSALVCVWADEFGLEATKRALEETERYFDAPPPGDFSGRLH
jgi:hypothetical protein